MDALPGVRLATEEREPDTRCEPWSDACDCRSEPTDARLSGLWRLSRERVVAIGGSRRTGRCGSRSFRAGHFIVSGVSTHIWTRPATPIASRKGSSHRGLLPSVVSGGDAGVAYVVRSPSEKRLERALPVSLVLAESPRVVLYTVRAELTGGSLFSDPSPRTPTAYFV